MTAATIMPTAGYPISIKKSFTERFSQTKTDASVGTAKPSAAIMPSVRPVSIVFEPVKITNSAIEKQARTFAPKVSNIFFINTFCVGCLMVTL